MIRIKIPFQFKIYILILLLFVLMFNIMGTRINTMVSDQFIQEETLRFEGLKTLFYNLLRLKIESLENEAQLLADQAFVSQALETLADGRLVESFLVYSVPRADRRELVVIVTDKNGNVVDGILPTNDDQNKTAIRDLDKIQQFLTSFPQIDEVLKQGFPLTSYVINGNETPPDMYVLSCVPVLDREKKTIVGSITIGFPVDEKLAQILRSRSRYHIGFILGEQIIASTLERNRTLDLSYTWSNLPRKERQELLDKPQVINLFNEKYLAYAAPLPISDGDQGWYLILRSLQGTFSSLQQLRSSVLGVSIIILCVTLLIGYILARGVTAPLKTLAETVSRIAQGDYNASSTVRTGDELETLGKEINQMAQTLQVRENEIQDYVRQIEEWNRELEAKVAERTKDLEEKNFRLRTISKELGQAYAQIDDELKMVAQLQKKLLPDTSMDFENYHIRSFYLPNGRTGGDYYDYIFPDKRFLFFLIADVSGHGTPAAFIMGITRAMAHSMIRYMHSPAEVLKSLSKVLLKTIRSGEFVTMFLGCMDFESMRLTYSAAGHLPPFLQRVENKELNSLDVNRGLPLGIMEDPDYEEVTIQINPGDRLLLYTDGIIEAQNERKVHFGEERLKEILMNNSDLPPDDLLDRIMQELEEFVQRPLDIEPLEDDVTLVTIDFDPKKVPLDLLPAQEEKS